MLRKERDVDGSVQLVRRPRLTLDATHEVIVELRMLSGALVPGAVRVFARFVDVAVADGAVRQIDTYEEVPFALVDETFEVRTTRLGTFQAYEELP
jgi:hypothetical protein